MQAELAELAERLRDEAMHLRVLARERRNRAQVEARHQDEALERIEGYLERLENLRHHTPKEAQGEHHDRPRNAYADERGTSGERLIARAGARA